MIRAQRLHSLLSATAWLALSAPCVAQHAAPPAAPTEQVVTPAPPEPEPPAPPLDAGDPLLFKQGPWTLKLDIFAGSQVAAESNSFWDLSEVFAPTADYSVDRVWDEVWFVPTLRAWYAASDSLEFYAGLGFAATGNIGRDVFDQGNAGRVSLENAYGGFRLTDAASGFTLDISGGQQEYSYGSGMLIYLGAQNGAQRGATLVSPRRSWQYTGVARLTADRLSADFFVLDYNAFGPTDPTTTLAGGKLEYRLSEKTNNSFLGMGYLYAFESTMPYVSAPVSIIENGRQDTQTVNPYLRLQPFEETLPGLYAALEGAYQWNDRIDLSSYAFSAEVGYQWTSSPLMPKLSYAYREFSGDDPNTAALERFDPLFYDGGVHAFASGSNAALAFYNTNVSSHRLSLSMTLTPADFLTLSYWRVDAAEENSPLQFGQGGRIEYIDGQPVLVSGVPTTHLSDDFYLEFVRALSPNAYLTFGVGVSFPGEGLEGAAGQPLDPWAGGLVNLTFQF